MTHHCMGSAALNLSPKHHPNRNEWFCKLAEGAVIASHIVTLCILQPHSNLMQDSQQYNLCVTTTAAT